MLATDPDVTMPSQAATWLAISAGRLLMRASVRRTWAKHLDISRIGGHNANRARSRPRLVLASSSSRPQPHVRAAKQRIASLARPVLTCVVPEMRRAVL
jgi:hypothetical protein